MYIILKFINSFFYESYKYIIHLSNQELSKSDINATKNLKK